MDPTRGPRDTQWEHLQIMHKQHHLRLRRGSSLGHLGQEGGGVDVFYWPNFRLVFAVV